MRCLILRNWPKCILSTHDTWSPRWISLSSDCQWTSSTSHNEAHGLPSRRPIYLAPTAASGIGATFSSARPRARTISWKMNV